MTERADWLAWRRGGIGGSDIAALLGLSSFSSPWALWAEKVGLLPDEPMTQRQRIGLRAEAMLSEEFHDETGLFITGEQTWCTDPAVDYRRCTVDGFVSETDSPSIDETIGTWQCKTWGTRDWRDGIPPAIRAQCIWEMGVTAMKRCWLTVMFSGFRIEHYEIAMDADAKADLAFMNQRADRFWTDCVLPGIPPAVDGSDATQRALNAAYSHVEPGESTTVARDVVEALSAAKERMRVLKTEIAGYEAEIKASLGSAEIGVGDDGQQLVTWRSVERGEFTVQASTFRQLRIITKKEKAA